MSKRKALTRGQLVVIVSMICIMLLAVTMSVYFASMTAHKYGQNTIYIASLGTVSASATAMGKLYPGGTASTPMKFELEAGDYQVTDVLLTNYRLTSFTLEWGSSGSKTFLPQNGDNGPIITTTAGEWAFELNLGTGMLSTREPLIEAHMDITVPQGAPSGSMGNPNYGYLVQSVSRVSCTFEVSVGLSDILREDMLTVYQAVNTSSKNWTKVGYNAKLNAQATKIEENSLDDLHTMLTNANGGNVVTNANDDYLDAVVYRDIDLVNIDIATGEPIGRLSDLNYSFEWYGGTVTLPANTILASGRKLTAQETFTVDVYTYYPEFYIRRWVEDNCQYISISDKFIAGGAKIDDWYTATFESTLFNPNGDIANLNGKIIPRSYVNNYCPLTNGSTKYIHDNYYPTASVISGYDASTIPAKYMEWATNLTTAWKTADKISVAGYLPNASIAQGENYVAYVYKWLYLIKYANNDSQAMVGYGNVNTNNSYVATGVTVNAPIGVLSGSKLNANYESQKGGAVIGCYNTGTANDTYKHSSTNMTYGYNYTNFVDNNSNNSGKVKGMYTNQFLTNSYNGKRVLLDGYVGVDRYTSVFCLGLCNPWGNIWQWVFGDIIRGVQNGDKIDLNIYTTFDNYNGNNWHLSQVAISGNNLTSGNLNYVKMSYNLFNGGLTSNYLGTSEITSSNNLQSLVGLPNAEGSGGGGLTDYFYTPTNKQYLNYSYAIVGSGAASYNTNAGCFCFYFIPLNYTYPHIGFRTMLVQ